MARLCPLVVAAWVSSLAACVGAGSEAQPLAEAYADVLLRELRTDEDSLRAVRDDLAGKRVEALAWVDWIDEIEVTGSARLMDAARDLSYPRRVALRSRVYGELGRMGHWSVIPDPGIREDLDRYHTLASRLNGMGEAERLRLREHLSDTLERDEWIWLYDVPSEGDVFVGLKDSVDLLWNDEFRTTMRLLVVSLGEQLEIVDEMLSLRGDLEQRVREWRGR